VQEIETAVTLDRERLRDITLDDTDLMREILAALLDDTAKQVGLLDAAIRDRDGAACKRLAHYSKGACANVGADAAAALLKEIECSAAAGEFERCLASLAALAGQLDLLRSETVG
jgi:HPt (histidine-containing phosphotransfer) domain-containing protein